MIQKPDKLYLELIKEVLSYSLWPEPPIPIMIFNHLNSPFKKIIIMLISKILGKKDLLLAKKRNITENQRKEGEIWPVYAHTMIGRKRLDNLQISIEAVLKEGIEGDLIETGVWRGGACIFMRAVLATHGIENRKVIVADSFMGLPKPDVKKNPKDKGDIHYTYNYLAVSKAEVLENFNKYGLLDDNVVFLEGWFKDTLPKASIEKLSILRLDCDMYSSTIEALEYLYPKLSKGGFCIIDDYVIEKCKLAVNDYRSAHNINSEMIIIDNSSVYWRNI
jgi:O-methyltransferase